MAQKNPRLQTHVRSQTGITVTLPQHARHNYSGSHKENSEALPRGNILLIGFLIVSYVLLRFSKFL
ncbi:MAG: hypothetical protein SPL64_06795, partial [Bacteroidaceae bacterium]|nr:hypothetical protein [Bacteroidaceae bacterium]